MCGSLDRQLLDVRLRGVQMEDPVYVDLVSGYVHELAFDRAAEIIGFSSLPLWDAPVLVIDRSAVPVAAGSA